jgi:Domain of unknown function (DUF5597)/Glycosyl hydrolases family 35
MRIRGVCLWPLLLGLSAQTFAQQADAPRLEKIGTLTRLAVDGKPFLVLGGELHNSSSSSLTYMRPIWPKLAAMNLNTVLTPVSWELVEPQEGKFDFSLVDGLISQAAQSNLHLVFLWFGSWKNGVSTYAPGWVKENVARFPRAQDEHGANLDILSTFGRATREADAHAYAALMKHIHEVDTKHTVLMMQVENEVGVLGPGRDRSAAANAAWGEAVPSELMEYLSKHKNSLEPKLFDAWKKFGSKQSGTWPQVFGDTRLSEEFFMAWQYARYVDAVAEAGKAEYPIPMYANAWQDQYPGQPGGDHPSGGPVSYVLDIWQAAAPHIDILSPDIYLPDFRTVTAHYQHNGNPLFIPEARGQIVGGSNALYSLGQGALGFSPFAIDSITGNEEMTQAYRALEQLTPLLVKTDRDHMGSVVQQTGDTKAALEMGGYLLRITYIGPRGEAPGSRPVPETPAAGLFINSAPNEFFVAGQGISIDFSADSAGPPQTDLLEVEDGSFVNGTWEAERRLNGDETNGGNHVILRPGAIGIQRVRLYRHD